MNQERLIGTAKKLDKSGNRQKEKQKGKLFCFSF